MSDYDMDDVAIRNDIKEIKIEIEKNKEYMSFNRIDIELLEEIQKSNDYKHKISLTNKLKKNLSDNADFLINEKYMTIDDIIDTGLEWEKNIKIFEEILELENDIETIQKSIKTVERMFKVK